MVNTNCKSDDRDYRQADTYTHRPNKEQLLTNVNARNTWTRRQNWLCIDRCRKAHTSARSALKFETLVYKTLHALILDSLTVGSLTGFAELYGFVRDSYNPTNGTLADDVDLCVVNRERPVRR